MTPDEVMDEANKFADENIGELASDLVYLSEKSVLPGNGKFRELRRIVDKMGMKHSSFSIAQTIVHHKCLRIVANKDNSNE